jgi:hypothetical protein
MSRRPALISLALLTAVTATLLAPAADAAYTAKPQAALQKMFDNYGNAGTGDRWTGGMLDQSVVLPDGRTLWIFGNTYLGTVAKNGSRAATTPTVANSYVVQAKNKGALGATLLGAGKTALFKPTEPGHFYEPATAIVEKGKLYQVLWLMANGSLPERVDVATVALPSLKVESITTMPYVNYIPTAQTSAQFYPPIWGGSIVTDGKYDYVYGYENTNAGFAGFIHVSRIPVGQLASASPEYWNGTAWGPVPVTSARLFGGAQVGTRSFTVTKTAKGFRALTQGHTQTGIYEWSSPSPTGKWLLAANVYTFKEEATNKAAGFGPQNSAPTRLPQYETKGNQLVFAYLNDGGPDRVSHVKKYRPVFLVATDA